MSSKSASHRATMKILRGLFGEKPKKIHQVIRELDINNGYQLMRYLRSRDLISEIEIGGERFVTITEKGSQKVVKADTDSLAITKMINWDKKWRLVFFDIPEKHKAARNMLSSKLKEMGFKQIQKSAYISPYECLNEIEQLRCFYNLRQYVFLATISEIEGEDKLIALFKLNK